MLTLIIEKEIRDIIGSTKFAVTFAVCSLLILLAFYVGAMSYQTNVHDTRRQKGKISSSWKT